MKTKYILIVNAGSSSLKIKLFNFKLKEAFGGIIEKIGLGGSFIAVEKQKNPPSLKLRRTGKKTINQKIKDHQEALQAVVDCLVENGIELKQIVKIGHRVVHGGEKFVKPTLITSAVLRELAQFNRLAPLHNPHNLAGIEACLKLFPNAKNYAAFDTAFHSTMPDFACQYPLPEKFYKKMNIRRYGFHGLSHQYVSLEAAKRLKIKKPNLIACHLGGGCSICAIKKGKSVDTSMGFTPLEGLMMMTRTGDIDAGIILYLARKGFTLSEIDDWLNKKSGLLGVSGLKDMRDIMIANGYAIPGYSTQIKFTDEQKKSAKLALEMFVYRIKKYIGAYSIILGKVDAIVFTAGIGERNKDVRNLIVRHLPNKPKVLVIPADEEMMIAGLIR
ncbi:MAG: acetate/propionate family kinase [Parcubacteria group bacterium]